MVMRDEREELSSPRGRELERGEPRPEIRSGAARVEWYPEAARLITRRLTCVLRVEELAEVVEEASQEEDEALLAFQG